MLEEDVMFAHKFNGKELPVEHGGPVRIFTPNAMVGKEQSGSSLLSSCQLTNLVSGNKMATATLPIHGKKSAIGNNPL